MTALTLYEKLIQHHCVDKIDEEHILLYVDLHILNEYTSPQAFAGLAAAQRQVRQPTRQFAVVDHIVPTHPQALKDRVIIQSDALLQSTNLQKNCHQHGIRCLDINHPDQGIEHVITPELGLIKPGMTVLCGDSHTTTYGAFGALGFGIGTSEVEHILATQTLVYRVAKNMRIEIQGTLPPYCLAKDLVMHIVKTIGTEGALGMAVELCGEGIMQLSMEGRMTLCNMMVEAGARAALIAPDQTTLSYLSGVVTKDDLAEIIQNHLHWHSDPEAKFEHSITLSAKNLAPIVSWGTSPDQAIGIHDNIPHPISFETKHQRDASQRALEYMGLNPGQTLQGLPVSRVFIGSCTNGRIEDLRSAAAILKGRHIHPNVRTMVVPGSGRVRRQAEAEGLHEIFLTAGCEWRQPGCSMCLAMNDDVLAPQERCASTTNRNFEGRQGRAGRTHLMSPAMAAAAALAGHITDVRELINEGK